MSPPSRSVTRLRKKDIRPGFVVWLPCRHQAAAQDPKVCGEAGLNEGAFNHPVVIVKIFDSSKFLWISVMTSKQHPKHSSILVKCPHMQYTNAFVGTEKVYEVSLPMLRKDLKEVTLGRYALDSRQVKAVQDALKPAMRKLEVTSKAAEQISAHVPSNRSLSTLPSGSTTVSSAVPQATSISAAQTRSSRATSSDSNPSALTRANGPASSSMSASNFSLDKHISTPQTSRLSHQGSTSVKRQVESTSTSSTAVVSTQQSPLPVNRGPAVGSKQSGLPSRPASSDTHIKPGAILWLERGQPRTKRGPLAHLEDTKNRPCVVLSYDKDKVNVEVVVLTSFDGIPFDGVIEFLPAGYREYYFPIARHDKPQSQVASSLHTLEGRSLKGVNVSYVNANQVLNKPPSYLATPRERAVELTAESLAFLLGKVKDKKAEEAHPAVMQSPAEHGTMKATTAPTKLLPNTTISFSDARTAFLSVEAKRRTTANTASKPMKDQTVATAKAVAPSSPAKLTSSKPDEGAMGATTRSTSPASPNRTAAKASMSTTPSTRPFDALSQPGTITTGIQPIQAHPIFSTTAPTTTSAHPTAIAAHGHNLTTGHSLFTAPTTILTANEPSSAPQRVDKCCISNITTTLCCLGQGLVEILWAALAKMGG